MKKIAVLILFTALIACNKNTNQETKNSNVLWAETVQSSIPLIRDTLCDEAYWKAAYKYDKEKIFSTITHAILAGKLKAYYNYPSNEKELTAKEFNNIIVVWDSTHVTNDPDHPGTMVIAPMKSEITADDIVEIRLNEKVELDTLSYSLSQKVSSITFLTYKYDEKGNILGLKHLFDVKLNSL